MEKFRNSSTNPDFKKHVIESNKLKTKKELIAAMHRGHFIDANIAFKTKSNYTPDIDESDNYSPNKNPNSFNNWKDTENERGKRIFTDLELNYLERVANGEMEINVSKSMFPENLNKFNALKHNAEVKIRKIAPAEINKKTHNFKSWGISELINNGKIKIDVSNLPQDLKFSMEERIILELTAQGYVRAVIGRKLNTSDYLIGKQQDKLKSKLGAKTTLHLVALASHIINSKEL